MKKASILRRAVRTKSEQRGYKLHEVCFTLGVEMGSASLDFYVIYSSGKKEQIARCKAQYGDI